MTGRVLDAEGRPVVDAEVRFTLNPESRLYDGLPSDEQQRLHTVRSDAQGAFQIDTLRPGAPYDVVVVRRGFATLLTLFSSRAVGLTPEFQLVLRPGKTARGQVLDGRGRPVEGARIWLDRSTRDGVFTIVPLRKVWADHDLHQAVTGPDGCFELSDLPEQPLDLTIWGSGFAPLVRPGLRLPAADQDPGDTVGPLDFRHFLGGGGRFRGAVPADGCASGGMEPRRPCRPARRTRLRRPRGR